jgi:hypothetical protein
MLRGPALEPPALQPAQPQAGSNPKRAVPILEQREHLQTRQPFPQAEHREADAVEPAQPIIGRQPQVAIAGLQDRIDGIVWEAILDFPGANDEWGGVQRPPSRGGQTGRVCAWPLNYESAGCESSHTDQPTVAEVSEHVSECLPIGPGGRNYRVGRACPSRILAVASGPQSNRPARSGDPADTQPSRTGGAAQCGLAGKLVLCRRPRAEVEAGRIRGMQERGRWRARETGAAFE